LSAPIVTTTEKEQRRFSTQPF